jgi:transcriptional regulator with XRE-family HTH domain
MNPQDAVIRLLNAGWTQARLAQKAGCSQSTIHRIKTGRQPRGASYSVCAALLSLASSLPPEPVVAVDAQAELSP